MALFRSERGIGRGEAAESQLEAPIFIVFLVVCSLLVLAVHLYLGNQSITIAVAVSMLVFGITVAHVEFGVAILVVAMLLSPEIGAGNQWSGRYQLNVRYDDVLIIIIFLGVVVKLAFEGRLYQPVPTPINTAIILYYSLCIFSTLLALKNNLPAWDARSALFVALKMLEYYMVFFLTARALKNLGDVRRQLIAFFIVAMIISVYGISSIGAEARVGTPFESEGSEPNTLGGYLVVVICTAMGLYTQAPKLRHKLLLASVALTAFAPLLYTLSRASYLAIIAGLFTVGLVGRRVSIIFTLLATLLASPFIAPTAVKERVLYTFQTEGAQPASKYEAPKPGRELRITVDKSTEERFLVWRKVNFMMHRSWPFVLFGGGLSWETVMDSQYARVVLETGVCGVLAFVFLQLSLCRSIRQTYRWTTDWVGKGLGIGVFATTIALIVHAFGTISFLIVRIMEPYWFLVGLTVLVRNLAVAEAWQKYYARQRARTQPVTAPRAPGNGPAPTAVASPSPGLTS